jgi:oligopeptide transport system substrate-binding protein
MKFLFAFLILLSGGLLYGAPPFRFHLQNEPASLKPWQQKNSGAGYLLTQITGTLLTYQNQKLSGNLAEICVFKSPLKIVCTLRKDLKWSDGKPLTAADFVRAFQEFLNPTHPAFRADLVFSISNARKVFAGELPKEQLKVRVAQAQKLEIELENPDPEFLYVLANPLLYPIPEAPLVDIEEIRKSPSTWKSSGPYVIESWEAQKKIVLKNNPEYWKKKNRPSLEVIAVTEDSVALNLYEKGELTLLRRLPLAFIPKFRSRPDYFEIEQLRFDYLGFSSKWKSNSQLRKAMAQTLRYTELQNLYHSKGRPGCPGIPESLRSENVCLEFNLKAGQELWGQLKPKPAGKFELLYSRQGGDDHRRAMEWIQSEWKQNLDFSIEVSGLENKIFQDRVAQNPTDLFRKGIAPDRPTCSSALEIFETGNSENYIRFSNLEFDAILKKMKLSSNAKEKKKLCAQGLHLLIDEAWIIPTGPIHFTLLARPEWKNWKLNELNQLDLSELEYKP